MSKKVISLDNLKVIKNYIDTVRRDVDGELDANIDTRLKNQLASAKAEIENDYNTKITDLTKQLEQCGSEEELTNIKLRINELIADTNDKFDALDALEVDLKRLSGEYDSLYEGITTNSIFSEGQLDSIIRTAMIKEVSISENAILTPEMYATKVVSLIGNFGQIKAGNIIGGDISGHTIKSNNYIKGTLNPVWMIGNAGDGWLASGNIRWDEDGNVTFGEDVKLSWNNVTDIPDYVGGSVSIFTSTVFIRQNEKPSVPIGGSFLDPLPRTSINDGAKWEDSIPDGEEILWSSTRIFASDIGHSLHQISWSEPVQMTDTSDFEVIFGAEDADMNGLPELPITDGLKNHNGWYDNDTDIAADGKEAWYMATATCKNGVWKTWNISKIKGENGTDGKSVNIKGSFDTLDEFKEQISGENLNRAPEDTSSAYIVAGDLYIWSVDESIWKNVGRFTGTDGLSKFKSIIFKRSNTPLTEKPTGGSWEKPIADGWEDGIPVGTGIIWMSYRTWYSNDSLNENIEWSTPKVMQDSTSFDVAYGTSKATNEDGSINTEGLPKGAGEKADPTGQFMPHWYDEPDHIPEGSEIWYMATAECNNGEWSKWTVSKIKGENGTNGTSIEIVKKYESLDAFKKDFGESLNIAPDDPSQCYLVTIDGSDHMFVWVALMHEWIDQGPFGGVPGKDGEDGISNFLHMKYAKSLGEVDDSNVPLDYSKIELTEHDGEDVVDAKWIGIGKTDSISNPEGIDPDPRDSENGYIYKWTRIYVDPIITPAKFKSMVFARIPESVLRASETWPKSVKVTGGDWNNPIPEKTSLYGYNIVWEDGVPQGNNPIWTTVVTFDSEKDYSDGVLEWETPKLMADNDSFKTAYAPVSIEVDGKVDKSGLPTQNNKVDGLADPDKGFTKGWVDEPEAGVEYYYMATAQKSGGTWSTWNIFKIKGEKGDKGGSVKLSTAFNTIDELIEYYSDGVNGTNGEPIDAYKDNAHIVKTGPNWENHLFVWIGEDRNDSSLTDGDYFYKGWYDSGQFNGKDGKDGSNGKDGLNAYLHVKYAKKITYVNGVLDANQCEPTKNGGESTEYAKYIGICNDSEENDPIIDKDHIDYNAENWSKYKWSEFITSTDVNERVTTTLGTYHISSDHIAGKTMDTSVDVDGEQNSGYVKLIDDTPYRVFTMGENGQETGYRDYIAGEDDPNDSMGPAWQLRTNGTGYFAKGNIRWDENGNVTFGPDVKLSWNNVTDIPEIPESSIDETKVEEIIQRTEIDGTKIKTNSITANQIATGTITANQIATGVLTADTIIGEELVGKTVRSSDNAWKIDKSGDGWLANKNIEWDADGGLVLKGKEFAVNGKNIMFTEYDIHPDIDPRNFHIESYSGGSVGPTGSFDIIQGTGQFGNTCPVSSDNSTDLFNIGYLAKGAEIKVNYSWWPALTTRSMGSGTHFKTDAFSINQNIPVIIMLYRHNGYEYEFSSTYTCFIDEFTLDEDHIKYEFNGTTLTINQNGMYAISFRFPKELLYGVDPTGGYGSNEAMGEYTWMLPWTVLTSYNNVGNFTQIAPNGLISKSNNCILFINDTKVEMSAYNNKNECYGFRITPSGIQYCNGTSNWTAWNP